jgi:hypothetical protein
MYWKAGSYFTILRIVQAINPTSAGPGGQPVTSQTKVVWDSRD